MAKDPVCEMEIEEANAHATSEYGGKTYYFCSSGCASRFQKDPQAYLKD